MTISADVNDPGDTESRRSDADDVARGTVDGFSEVVQDDDKEIPSNLPDRENFFPNVSSLSIGRQPEALDLQERGQREAVVERPTEQPLLVPNDHVGDGAPNPAQSDRSERECQ